MRDKPHKKIISLLLLLVFLLAIFIVMVSLDRPVIFKDLNLESAIREKLDHYYKPVFRSQLLGIVELDLSNRGIQDLTGIEHIRNLEVLNLRFNNVLDVSPLSTLTNLNTLDLGYNHISDLETSHFHLLQHLEIVDLNLDHNIKGVEFLNEQRLSDLSLLHNFSHIRKLSLTDNQITDIIPLKELSYILELDLSNNAIQDLNGIENLRNLEELNLRGNHIEDISKLSNLTSLRYLNLHSNTNIKNISPIQNLVNLETLILRNVPINTQMDVLSNLNKLERLNIRNCGITNIDVLVDLMKQGALQDNPGKGIMAYLDIMENQIPENPYELRALSPYWDNIHTTYPLQINGSILNPPVLSHDAGFYNESFSLTMQSEGDETVIYYTLDGSDPTKDSILYVNPILIEGRNFSNVSTMGGTVIRAKAFSKHGFDTSPTVTKTYFVGPSSKSVFTLPVVSLVTDPDHLFDPEFGLYTRQNYRRRGKKWERPLHIEFFEVDEVKSFDDDILFRLHGQTSRNLPQKSLRLYGENNYDQFETMDYPFFPDLQGTGTQEPIEQFKTLLFRNSGNDWNKTLFLDALVHKLVEHTTLDIQAYRPVNVFLNGTFWGIYNIRERMDEYYIENHYGVESDQVLMYEVSKYDDFYNQDPGQNEYLTLLETIKTHQDSPDELYKTLDSQIDIQNFIDNQVIYLYANNMDWLGNNVKFWKVKQARAETGSQYGLDGRWRWLVIDFDFGFRNYELNLLPQLLLETDRTLILRTLLANPDYRNLFINHFADALNTTFLPSRVINEIDIIQENLEPDINNHILRWGAMNYSIEQWYNNINALRHFAEQRPTYAREQLMETFEISGLITLNINANPEHGYITVNSIDILDSTPGIDDPSSWSGVYFKDIPITLTANPSQGYQFSHWEGVNTDDIEDETIMITAIDDLQIVAVFTPSGSD